jgi:ECF transporter S component (folate family)
MDINNQRQYTKKIIQTGLFVALALVIRNFSYMVYFGGAAGMRVGFSGIFTKLPAILFGPMFGGLASGIMDILGFLIKPEGAYIPLLTITAVLGGVITGFLWRVMESRDINSIKKILLTLFIAVGFIGIINHINTVFFPNSAWAAYINKIGKNKDFVTFGLELTALIGAGLLAVNSIVMRRSNNNSSIQQNYLKVLVSTGAAGIIVTTLNTYILQLFIPALAKKGFILFLIPRVVEEVFMAVIQAYIISFLLSVYRRIAAKNL